MRCPAGKFCLGNCCLLAVATSPLTTIFLYKCPVQSCSTWSAINKGKGADETEHRKHIWKHSLSGAQYASASCIEPQSTQILQIGEITGKGSSIIFIVPHETESHHSAFPIPKSTTTASPAETWATELGWDDELQRIVRVLGRLKKDAVGKLQDLVELPSRDRVLKAQSGIFKFVEQGLWESNRLNIRYFTDVISWIAGKNSSFPLLFGHDRSVLCGVYFITKTDFFSEKNPFISL